MEKIINEFMDAFQKNVPPALCEVKEVVNEHARLVCESVVRKMDLVSREEFDTQVLLLRRAQENLRVLQDKITELSKQK